MASYLEARRLPCIWYQVDDRDADVSTLFYYLGVAARREAPRRRRPLPYLTPEYLPGLQAFARRYFESFYERLKPPFVLVFDNCQEVPPDARLHDVIRESLALVPAGFCLFLISRAAPPPALSRPLANRAMALLGWEELRFERSEAEQLLRKNCPPAVAEVLRVFPRDGRIHAIRAGQVDQLRVELGMRIQRADPASRHGVFLAT